MDRRRFFMNKTLNEGLSSDQKSNLLEDVFAELNHLYEADEAADNAETAKPTADNDALEILSELKDSNYVDFVKILNSDGKSKAFLDYLKQHYKFGDDAIKTIKKASASLAKAKCSRLIPTQQNISLSKSLGMINKPGWSEKIINTPLEAFDDPTIVYAGKYIIDGHHRWSKAYALNGGDCEIKVLNFPAIDGVSWEDMLKATQLAIVAANPSAKLVNEVGNDNMLKSSKEEIKKFVIDNVCDEVVSALKAKGKGDTKETVAENIGNNVVEMQRTSQPVKGAAPRSVMPQTDAAPGSLDKLQKAVIDLSEELSINQKQDLLEDVFAELNHLYEELDSSEGIQEETEILVDKGESDEQLEEGIFDTPQKKAEFNNAMQEFNNQVKEITQGFDLYNFGQAFALLVQEAVGECKVLYQQNLAITDNNKLQQWTNHAQVVTQTYESLIKAFKKPDITTIRPVETEISRGVRNIINAAFKDSYEDFKTVAKIKAYQSMITAISDIKADQKIKKAAYKRFYEGVLYALTISYSAIKGKGPNMWK